MQEDNAEKSSSQAASHRDRYFILVLFTFCHPFYFDCRATSVRDAVKKS